MTAAPPRLVPAAEMFACWFAAARELDDIDRATGLDQLGGWRPLASRPNPTKPTRH